MKRFMMLGLVALGMSVMTAGESQAGCRFFGLFRGHGCGGGSSFGIFGGRSFGCGQTFAPPPCQSSQAAPVYYQPAPVIVPAPVYPAPLPNVTPVIKPVLDTNPVKVAPPAPKTGPAPLPNPGS